MSVFHRNFEATVPDIRAQRQSILEKYGDRVVSQVTTAQVYGGLRGVNGLVCDTSVVDPQDGLKIRGIPVLELVTRSPEDVFFLLLIGRLPTDEESQEARATLAAQAPVPDDIWEFLRASPSDTHPMAMLSAGVTVMDRESRLREAFASGASRDDYWRFTLDDGLRLLSALPQIAAGIYRLRYGHGDPITPDPNLDWAGNFGRMLAISDEAFAPAMRMASILQSDHEGGNVCAFACHTVGSVLSNCYLAVAAGFNGLAGPLHGLASQMSTRWVLDGIDRYGGALTADQVREYTWETLNARRVVPGYGHAVLRGLDPRFTAVIELGRHSFPDDPVFATVDVMSQVIPEVLKEHGKAKNPYPNVDAGMGALWYHFGIRELEYYTVPFAISLAIGMVAQLVINRALGTPITRPRSVTAEWLETQTND